MSLSASCGRFSENEKAQRSKVIGAPSRNKLWAPQVSRDTRMTVFKNLICYAPVEELAALSLSASCGRFSENEKAQRSKVIGAPSRNKLWAPQESRDTRMTVFKNLICYAPVAELADAYGSGPYFFTGVQVRFLSGAPKTPLTSG